MAPAFQILPHRSSSSVSAKIHAAGSPFPSLHRCFGAPGARRLHKLQSLGCSTNSKRLSWPGPAVRRELGLVQVSANSKAEEPLPPEMSMESALRILGVAEGDSFDEIIRAKSSLLSKHGRDSDYALQIEAAYDVLLMRSLMQRRSGKVVDSSILYADVKKTKAISGVGGQQWFSEALSKVPITVEIPTYADIGTQSAVFAGLAVWTFANDVSSHTSLNTKSDVPGVILAVGVGASIYFLRRQNVKFGKAVVLTVAGLVVGSVLGGAVKAWLHVDLLPILGIRSPGGVVSEFVLVSLWLSSLCLR